MLQCSHHTQPHHQGVSSQSNLSNNIPSLQEAGNAALATITTSKEGRGALDARKSSLRKIVMESQYTWYWQDRRSTRQEETWPMLTKGRQTVKITKSILTTEGGTSRDSYSHKEDPQALIQETGHARTASIWTTSAEATVTCASVHGLRATKFCGIKLSRDIWNASSRCKCNTRCTTLNRCRSHSNKLNSTRCFQINSRIRRSNSLSFKSKRRRFPQRKMKMNQISWCLIP